MTLRAGTYRATSDYQNSSERKERLAKIGTEMRAETEKNYYLAEEERRKTRLGILELRKERGLDIRPF